MTRSNHFGICDANIAPNRCHPDIYHECVNCDAEICGICLKMILSRRRYICPVCNRNIDGY